MKHISCQPLWMRRLQVGDVVQASTGPWRVVRSVTRKKNGDLHAISLTIRHCSWTGRCYTVIMASDLKQRGFRKVQAARWPCRTQVDRAIHQAINQPAWERPYVLKCCDVIGIY